MGTTAVAPAPGGEPARIGAFGRVTGVLFSPGATFQDIVRKPSFVAPLAILTLLALLSTFFLMPKVNWQDFMRRQIESNPTTAKLPDDQKEQRVAIGAKFAPVIGWCAAALFPTVFALILGLVYWVGFNLFKGAGLKFSTSFGISSHALIPIILGTILSTAVIILKAPGDLNPERLAVASLAAYLASDAPHWMVVLGNSVDLIWFWCLILLAIGFAAANPRKISKGSAFGVVFGLWLLWVAIRVGIAAI